MTKKTSLLVMFSCFAALALPALAGDLRITWPKHTKPTPVQALNQDGVNAVKKHQFAKAEKLFYKAYLLDPDDPFTLNNLGYISEIQGKVQRAEKYYKLAAQQNSDAVVQQASVPEVKGKELNQVAGGYANQDLQVNRGNVEAMSLLSQGRAQEAEDILRKTLDHDPQNAFTLNNLGSVMEAEGNLQAAVHYYNEAAARHSTEAIVVTENRQLAGKPISEVAANNAAAVQKRLDSTEENVQAQVARLNLQGVSALNHNDAGSARRFFEQAYKLDPYNAFTLNNMGYVSQMNGDQETAQQFYTEAQRANDAADKVTYANRREMQGLALAKVANQNTEQTQLNLEEERQVKIREGGPIVLKRRDEAPHPPVAPAPAVPAPK